ncbi:SRPBCC family protein [Aldersonia sp. NBC_00410]|uniref:SRPBCC family protein n=1 Tax=Aldersonia sp. NBC_00410 TaxID=2975954 RepID=UPI002B1CE5B3|nr:SRPBCC family protein [Aldersonia sp. NBC_00410]
MMYEVRVVKTIAAPIEDVFEWMTNSDNYRRVPGVFAARVLRPGTPPPQGPGAVREVVTAGMKLTERIVELDRPVLMRYRVLTSFPPMRHESGSMSFHAENGGTTVTWVSRFESTAPILTGLASRALGAAVAVGFRGVLRTAGKELGGAK